MKEVKKMAEQKELKEQQPQPLAKRVFSYLDTNNRKVKLTINAVRQFFCPTATDAEAFAFIQHCILLRANPWLRQIYLIKYDLKSPAQIVISRDFFLRLVSSMPNYRGMRSGVIVVKKKPIQNEVAEKVAEAIESILENYTIDEPLQNELVKVQLYCQKQSAGYEHELIEIEGAVVPPGCELFGGWCEIYLKNPDDPTRVIVIKQRVMLSEYNKGQATWRTMPATMIQACAERQASRKAFSEILGGVYGPEELGIPTTPEGEPIIATVHEEDEEDILEEEETESVDGTPSKGVD
jgi:phage recombination protein Bet